MSDRIISFSTSASQHGYRFDRRVFLCAQNVSVISKSESLQKNGLDFMDMHYKLRKVMNLKMTLDLMVQLLSKPQLVNLT